MHGERPESKEVDGIVLKQCKTCNEFKPLTEYYPNPRYHLGCQHICKKCNSNYSKKRNTYEKNKAAFLKTKYNLSLEQYNYQYKLQEGKCPICEEKVDVLVVDHCHIFKIIRGLICDNCNKGLGNFKDNIEILRSAIYYLEATNDMVKRISESTQRVGEPR